MAIKQSERIAILTEIEELARQLEVSRDPRRSYELSQKILAASMRLPVGSKKPSSPEKN
jgi:hypothetical protein